MLPQLLAARAQEKRLRIWSAACATGQEAYSLAMHAGRDGLPARAGRIDLIATDISGDAIARAEDGPLLRSSK